VFNIERKGGSVKKIWYGKTRVCEQKGREQVEQKYGMNAERTGVVPRYLVIEDEDSIFEYDLNCLNESERKSGKEKRIE